MAMVEMDCQFCGFVGLAEEGTEPICGWCRREDEMRAKQQAEEDAWWLAQEESLEEVVTYTNPGLQPSGCCDCFGDCDLTPMSIVEVENA